MDMGLPNSMKPRQHEVVIPPSSFRPSRRLNAMALQDVKMAFRLYEQDKQLLRYITKLESHGFCALSIPRFNGSSAGK